MISTSSRMSCSRKNQSARKVNSSGATGHLMGISTICTTRRPPSQVSQLLGQCRGAFEGVEVVDALAPLAARAFPASRLDEARRRVAMTS